MKRIVLPFLILLAFFAAGCSQRGPVTHPQAFMALKEAYQTGNDSALSSLLSSNSINYIKKIALALSRLQNSSKKQLAVQFDIEEDKLNNLTPQTYIDLYMKLNTTYTKDIVSETLDQKVVSISEAGAQVSYRMSNNVTLYFVKEEPYWKFDLERSVQ